MSELILVTGGAGFLASHIVVQLLESGYRVRTTARGAKVAALKKQLSRFGNKLDVIDIPDITTGVLNLDGVDAVMHTASPLPFGRTADQIMEGTIEGGLNVLRQAHKAGIKRFIYTSSVVAMWNNEMTFTDKDWNPMPLEMTGGNPTYVYMVAKTEGEKAIWKYAEEHKELDVTTLCPPFLYGPLAEGFPIPAEPNFPSISTDVHLYRLIVPYGHYPNLSGYLDVRDAAEAHIRALKGKPADPTRVKRFPISAPTIINYDTVVKIIKDKRPELADRLVKGSAPEYAKAQRVDLTDLKRIEEYTGYKPSEYHSLESTILDTVDSLIKLEKTWIANGHEVKVPVDA
jgi:nucleoside-diphosphate-sugar epimerase